MEGCYLIFSFCNTNIGNSLFFLKSQDQFGAMGSINQNIKYLRRLRRWTQMEMAAKIGIKRSLLGAYEEGRANPRNEVLERISDLFHISLDDLMRSDLNAKGGNYQERRRRLKEEEPRQIIEFVPVQATAGYLSGYQDLEFIEELNTFTLPMIGAGHFRAFEISGDSMLPVTSGSVIVGHKVTEWQEIKHRNTYIVLTRNEGIVYKRVLKSNRNKNRITLLSDNPQFESYSILLEDILEMWEADAVINKISRNQQLNVTHLAEMVNHLQEQVSVLKKKVK